MSVYTLHSILHGSVSDPLHFDADPDPRIRFRDNGSGSSSGSGSDLKSNKFQICLLNFFSVKGIKLITMFFLNTFELIIHVYYFLFKKL